MELKLTKQRTNNLTPNIDLAGEPVYIGIDVHKQQWKVSIRVKGVCFETYSMNPKAEELLTHLLKNYPGGSYHSVYETGFCGFCVHHALESKGIKNIVVNAADIPHLAKERMTKTDAVDSRKLSRELERGSLTGFYIPTMELEALRNLGRLRKRFCLDGARLKIRIKSFLNLMGEEVPPEINGKSWSNEYIKMLREIQFHQGANTAVIHHYLNSLLSIKKEEAHILSRIREEIRKSPERQRVINILMTIPGVGILAAVTIFTEIIDINRFRDIDHLKSYVGLSPAVYSSGEKERVLGLSWRYNRYLRSVLIEAAWVAIRKDPELRTRFLVLSRRMPKSKAIIRIANNLLSRISRVWSTGSPYVNKEKVA